MNLWNASLQLVKHPYIDYTRVKQNLEVLVAASTYVYAKSRISLKWLLKITSDD